MRTNISIFKYFLPLILAALFTTTAKADLVVYNAADSEVASNFYVGDDKFFTTDQWNVLDYGTGALYNGGTDTNPRFLLLYFQPFEFVATNAERVTVLFDEEGKSFSGSGDADSWFEFFYATDGKVDSLTFNLYDGDDESYYTVDFEATANLQNSSSTPTPEPATLLIFGAGLVGLGLSARRKRK